MKVRDPAKVKQKGRPSGALGGNSRIAQSSTQRNPSSHELTALQRTSISSSALAQLELHNRGIFIIPGPPASASITPPLRPVYRR
jgi:hypothetical protein